MSGKGELQEPYDPLSYQNLARDVVRALMDQPCGPLPPSRPFMGVGVYALYYTGGLDYYRSVGREDIPIYVGSAVPAGKRKGAEVVVETGHTLYSRLRQHARSITQTRNLSLADFRCRYLVVVPVWIGLAERFLIEHYQPIWNTTIDGFGNHDPGSGRKNMKRPRWDILHPGRSWAKKLRATESPDDIMNKLKR